MTMMAFVLAITANAQMFNVGTSNTTTDYFGNQTTTHRDKYGNTTGTSTLTTPPASNPFAIYKLTIHD